MALIAPCSIQPVYSGSETQHVISDSIQPRLSSLFSCPARPGAPLIWIEPKEVIFPLDEATESMHVMLG